MDIATVMGIVSVAVNVLIFVIGALILPNVQKMKDAAEQTAKDIHGVQVELAKLQTQMASVEGLRSNLHNLRDDLHAMQMRMALAGMWAEHKPTE